MNGLHTRICIISIALLRLETSPISLLVIEVTLLLDSAGLAALRLIKPAVFIELLIALCELEIDSTVLTPNNFARHKIELYLFC